MNIRKSMMAVYRMVFQNDPDLASLENKCFQSRCMPFAKFFKTFLMNEGCAIYDSKIVLNGILTKPESFKDKDCNSSYRQNGVDRGSP